MSIPYSRNKAVLAAMVLTEAVVFFWDLDLHWLLLLL
jgi:hypothetical protein